MAERKVSILMPTYNDEEYIEIAINSVLNQSYNDWELIVIDGSDDKTPEIVKRFADDDDRIRYIRERKSGQLNALMQGTERVEGEFVTLLHSDDELSDREAIKRNVSALIEYRCDGVFSDLMIMDGNGEHQELVKTVNKLDYPSLALLFLRGGSNLIPDFFFVTREALANIIPSYMTWNMPYWMMLEGTGMGILNLRKVASWYRYRVYHGNYGHSDVGSFESTTGVLRTVLEIGKRMSFPLLGLQRSAAMVLRARIRPLFRCEASSAKDLRAMVRFVVSKRYGQIPRGPYFDGVLGFYSNFPSKRTIRLDMKEEDEIFLGCDARLFFSLMKEGRLPEIYEQALGEAADGFGKVEVRDEKDRGRTRDVLRFLNLLAEVE